MYNRSPEEMAQLREKIATVHQRAAENPDDAQLQEEARIIRVYQKRAKQDLGVEFK